MSGGFNDYNYTDQKPQRLNLIKQVVKETKPDIVSFIDTFRWHELYTNKQIAKLFGYQQACCISLDDNRLKKIGHDNGITVIANVDDISFETVRLKTRNAIKTTIKENKKEFTLYSFYLDDLKEDTRLEQVKSIEKELSVDSPQLIMGDLNTISPKESEKTKEIIKKLLTKRPELKELEKQVNDMARGEVIKYLINLGFKDASKQSKPTFPTSLSPFGDKLMGRLDYCLYKNLNIIHFEVLRGELYEKTSDHYPIMIEIEID